MYAFTMIIIGVICLIVSVTVFAVSQIVIWKKMKSIERENQGGINYDLPEM